jgi:hypothetical protein
MQEQQRDWKKSTRCGNAACVEVDTTSDENYVLVHDSKDASPELRYARSEWATVLGAIAAANESGQVEFSASYATAEQQNPATTVLVQAELGKYALLDSRQPDVLLDNFDADEAKVFVDAAASGEFSVATA